MRTDDEIEARRLEANRVRGLRRRAEKLGWVIRRNRMRKDPSSSVYGKYHLLDTATNGHLTPSGWSELGIVEELISQEEKKRGSPG